MPRTAPAKSTAKSKAKKEWWHTAPDGKRVGWMTPDRFDAIMTGYYGTRYWVKLFGADFDIAPASIYRWMEGFIPIKKEFAMLATLMAEKGTPKKMPTLSAPWLPEAAQTEAKTSA